MADEKILDIDPLTGLIRFHRYDEETGKEIFRTYQDTAPIMERCKALKNEEFNKKSEIWPIADVPLNILYMWRDQLGVDFENPDHEKGLRALLAHGDYANFRTSEFNL